MAQDNKTTASLGGADLSALEEKFPRIAMTLCECWGKAACGPYLRSLVFDERGGRQGFPPEVGAELLMLNGLLDIQSEACQGLWVAH